jgi:hypothetical protein
MIIVGQNRYGVADDVPGIMRVESSFIHLIYMPVIYCGSSLALFRNGSLIGNVPIGFNIKSMLLGYARALLVLGAFGGAVVAFGEWISQHKVSMLVKMSLACTFVCGPVAVLLTYAPLFRRCSYKRALRLADRARLSHQFRIRIDAHYNVLTQEEADELMAELKTESQK